MTDAAEQTKGLSEKQLAFVAAYLGPARLNATRAAEMADYRFPNVAGSRLLSNVSIQAALAEWRESVKTTSIATVEHRLSRLSDLETRLWDVIDARSNLLSSDAESGGGATGLIVKQFKVIGGGENAQFVTEYVFDASVPREIRATYDDVAKELGQRVDSVNVSGSLKREYVIVTAADAGEGE